MGYRISIAAKTSYLLVFICEGHIQRNRTSSSVFFLAFCPFLFVYIPFSTVSRRRCVCVCVSIKSSKSHQKKKRQTKWSEVWRIKQTLQLKMITEGFPPNLNALKGSSLLEKRVDSLRQLNTTTVNQLLGLPGMTSTFTAPQLLQLRIIAITASAVSLIAGCLGMFFLSKMDKRRKVFRHDLIAFDNLRLS